MNTLKKLQSTKNLTTAILIGILLLAAFLRLINLSANPPGLYWEEAAIGYDAYSILKTGKDHHGNPWPLVAFESFGDFKPSGYFYATMPFAAIFGLNSWVVRLPSALAGILAIWLLYQFSRELKLTQSISLTSAAILAILPWHIHFSRAGFEVNLATTFLLAGSVLILKARKKNWATLPAAVLMGISMYTYHGLRLIAPLITLTIAAYTFKSIKTNRWLLPAAITGLILTLPLLVNLTNPQITQRFQETSRFPSSNAVEITNQKRAAHNFSLASRVIHHRYWLWGGEVLSGMMDHFNPTFLFLHGDSNPRHQSTTVALIYAWLVPFLLVGLYQLIKSQTSIALVVISWLLIAAFPAALTKTTPHTLRFLPAAPMVALITAVGLHSAVQVTPNKLKKLIIPSILVIALSFLAIYLYDYHQLYPKTSAQHWQVGYEELVNTVRQLPADQPIHITRDYGRPVMYLLFYSQYPPQNVQQQAASAPKDQSELLMLDHYRFTNQPPESGYWVTTTLQETMPLKTITDHQQNPIFYIYEI